MASEKQPTIPQAAAAASTRSALLGAIFLMATSAIGPGFLTQTAVFTAKHGAAFAFAIVVSIIIDIAVQMNVWRVIGLSGMRAQELGNRVIPGFGWLMALLIAIGGIVFNIGNIAGSGLGVNAMFGGDVKIGGVATAAIAIAMFLSKRAGMALDKILVVLGVVMMLLTLYVAFVSNPPVGSALKNAVLPEEVDVLTITTLVGGTVGGYITYAGAHRMLDSGQTGRENVSQVAKSSVTGIILTGLMRVLLFLAVLGVVAAGTQLNLKGNPAAEAFQAAAGDLGMRFFGVVLWAASISSVIGASYTSATFLIPNKPEKRRMQNIVTIVFILISCTLFVVLGTAPATLMVFAGAFNGLVLPLGFTMIMFVAAFRQKDLLDGYKYPLWLIILGVVGVAIAWWLAYISFGGVFKLLGT
ncbi:NRAMP family divalent metal transporter [Corynebacterium epidermidicanis]|uniref:Mn2+/Fe2-transporter, NRAMP family n=1 Tax=Corynebacterium epidermidicanis TaxID=1050174 RepID=A0A0G3GNH5_9CORY|nr:NRAMP family divalent metal transporter [Corynebacterium epidermidicanis]AKK02766.1 Mn2+/Fe2- transporter, NRAMP family [Corynebacterium epidermidicanis]